MNKNCKKLTCLGTGEMLAVTKHSPVKENLSVSFQEIGIQNKFPIELFI